MIKEANNLKRNHAYVCGCATSANHIRKVIVLLVKASQGRVKACSYSHECRAATAVKQPGFSMRHLGMRARSAGVAEQTNKCMRQLAHMLIPLSHRVADPVPTSKPKETTSMLRDRRWVDGGF